MDKKMENEMETGVTWGFKELELSHYIGGTRLLIILIPIMITQFKFLSSYPVKHPRGFNRFYRDSYRGGASHFLQPALFLPQHLLLSTSSLVAFLSCAALWRKRVWGDIEI